MCTHSMPISSNPWHEAAGRPVRAVLGWPFRAHLLHVAAALDLPWRAVALSAGLDDQSATRLMLSRPRSGLIPARQAASVLCVDAQQLKRRSRFTTDAHHSHLMVQALVNAGFSVAAVADFVRLPRAEAEDLLSGAMSRCTVRTELLISAALQAVGVHCPTNHRRTPRRLPLRSVA